jgi:hypothetical protein
MASVSALVAAELAEPVDPRVAAMAGAIAARYPGSARAVLFYGSCLRERQLEGLMLDFYLVVSDYGEAYGKRWLAAANRMLPPNVFPLEHDGLAAKYAVLSEADLERECGTRARSVSVWARFAQPARLVWSEDEAARARTAAAVAEAAPTLFALARPVMSGDMRNDPLAVFRTGFRLTYGAELRAERKERPGSIVDADPERYRAVGRAILAERTEEAEGVSGAPAQGQAPHRFAPDQGERDLRGRNRLPRLEDQPARRHCHRNPSVAAALAAGGGDQPAAAAASAGGHPLARRESAELTDAAKAETVNGFLSIS